MAIHSPSARTACSRPQVGFSLIELLVVISVISILASLLLPAFAKAKSKSQGIQCLQNLRTLQLGWGMYADENDSRLVWNPDGPDAGKVSGQPSWSGGWLSFAPATDNTNTELLVSPGSAAGRYGGLLGSYVGRNFNVFKCPADKSFVTIFGRKWPRVRSNSMNTYMNGARPDGKLNTWSDPKFRLFRRTTDFIKPNPAAAWVFIDEREDSINDACFGMDMPSNVNQIDNLTPDSFRMIDFPASYHNRAGGITFADGHAEIHKWQDERTMPTVSAELKLSRIFPKNPDVAWLSERTSARH